MDVGTNGDAASGRHARTDDTPETEGTEPAPAQEPARETAPAHEPAHRAPEDPADGPSRRILLAGGIGVGVVLAAGLGGGAALLWPETSRARPAGAPPAALVAAVAAEQALIADLDATTGGAASVRRGIAQARADHVAHLAVLRRALARYESGTSPAPTSSAASSDGTAPTGTARTAAQLRAAEQDAARDSAARAASLGGALATLLASISACEATHVRLLA